MESRRAGKRKQAEDCTEPAYTERILTRSAAKKARISPVPPLEEERSRRAGRTEEQAVARAHRFRTARRAALPATAVVEEAPEQFQPVGKGTVEASEQLQESRMDQEPAKGSGKGEGGEGASREEVQSLDMRYLTYCTSLARLVAAQKVVCIVEGQRGFHVGARLSSSWSPSFSLSVASYCCRRSQARRRTTASSLQRAGRPCWPWH